MSRIDGPRDDDPRRTDDRLGADERLLDGPGRHEDAALRDEAGLAEEPGRPVRRSEEDDSVPGRDEVVPSSKGLGAVYGDAERTPNPGPVQPPGPVDQAAIDAVAAEYEVGETEEGERYLTPRDDDTDAPRTTDDFPDRSPGA
ncbi:hypothetical protein [Sinomonas halotolerans]|uniref:DUF5709 domain-containing protein n=1 Tax=Sinomonas halotolerans TaxID=1644133 RepID=A0ABU9X091_9MICC